MSLIVVTDDRYRLIDFGDGRKLESVCGYVIDRPCPAAAWSKPNNKTQWASASAHYDADRKKWTYQSPWPDQSNVQCAGFQMPTAPTPFGHIGIFPEQAENWRWLAGTKSSLSPSDQSDQLPSALNLFGYTGASTMALVNAGYQVAHVDAAKPNVAAAGVAATVNGWDKPPIRYLIDDAAKFVTREIKRQRQYHTIVMDPPAYGHGPSGRAWRLSRDLWPLIDDCLKLIEPSDFRFLISGHSAEVDESDVLAFFEQSHRIDTSGLQITSGRSNLLDASDRSLDTGFFVRIETFDS
ncbi:class I SAM-dependent methyltransferase [Rubripirellula reticaptiva]|uniref:class I SAM-dependent methyltransferase n=1 Tax=Rubripirellula reticaptiva TaxID=2528013 RepID=UPI001FE5525F|nr:class I SAM-dependent methyltransferase [Rubripirellula reticaptiva]